MGEKRDAINNGESMNERKALKIRAYMDGLPDEVKKDVRWLHRANESASGILEEDTEAVLKAYGYMKYQYHLSDATEDYIYQVLCEKYNPQSETKFNEYLKGVISSILEELKLEADVKKRNKETELLFVMAVIRKNIENLKQIPVYGNKYYQILYYSYIDNRYNLNSEEIMIRLQISRTHFYRLRKRAIEELSNIMWQS